MNQPDLFDIPFNLAPESIPAPTPAPARPAADLIGALAAVAELRTIAGEIAPHDRHKAALIGESLRELEEHLADHGTAARAASDCAQLARALTRLIPFGAEHPATFARCVNARVALLEYEWTARNLAA